MTKEHDYRLGSRAFLIDGFFIHLVTRVIFTKNVTAQLQTIICPVEPTPTDFPAQRDRSSSEVVQLLSQLYHSLASQPSRGRNLQFCQEACVALGDTRVDQALLPQ